MVAASFGNTLAYKSPGTGRLLFWLLLVVYALLLTLLPNEVVPEIVTVRLLPSADTVILPLVVTLPAQSGSTLDRGSPAEIC